MIHKIHGNALSIFGYGVLITGDGGCGKTELSLALIDRGHKFIADDLVTIRIETLDLIPVKPAFMHIGGIGFIDVVDTYGLDSIAIVTKLNLQICMVNESLLVSERLSNTSMTTNLFGHLIPSYNLHTKQNRPLALLVEAIVKKQMQLDNGYDVHNNFVTRVDNELEINR